MTIPVGVQALDEELEFDELDEELDGADVLLLDELTGVLTHPTSPVKQGAKGALLLVASVVGPPPIVDAELLLVITFRA